MAIREGAWDCPHCGQKRNRGPEKHCSACGSARGAGVKFYLPDDAAEVSDEEALAQAASGPDWTCQYCETDNPSGYKFCSSCGASSDGAPPREVVEHRDEPVKLTTPPPPPPPPKKKRSCMSCGLAILAVVAAALFLLRPTKDAIVVDGHRWTRSIEVQTLVTETETAWEDEMPQGGRILSRERAIHHHDKVRIGTETKTRTVTKKVQTGTKKVKVGTKDMGNGYFKDIYEDKPVYENKQVQETYQEPVYREDPVYKMRFSYEVDRWKKVRDEIDRGVDQKPRWPSVTLGANEREGPRTEVYEVVFRDSKGNLRTYDAKTESAWRNFDVGERYKAEVRGKDTVTKILGPA